jgi:EAL domain-containing protein (putative c-di-GMP-specific phosphodiesterase class I)
MTDDPLKEFVDYLSRGPRPGADLWRDGRGEVVGRFLGLGLASVFQSVREAKTRRIVGHEAFIRSYDEADHSLSPWSLFSHAATDDQLVELDRTCRTIHAIRYFVRRPAQGSLFLNVHGRLMLAVQEDHGRTFRSVLDSLAIPASRIVIESPEVLTQNLALLGCVMQNYRRNGYRVAINLASANQASGLLSRFQPEFLKVDVRNLASADALSHIVARAARRGARVIVKRIETPAQVSLAQQGGADFLQGWAFDVPGVQPVAPAADPLSAWPVRGAAHAGTFLRLQPSGQAP